MNKLGLILAVIIAGTASLNMTASEPIAVPDFHASRGSQWDGKYVGMLGDSMSDPAVGVTSLRFYNYLEQLLGIATAPYARNGNQFIELLPYAERMKAEQGGNLDAIFVWCGTNDFNASRPIGTFFEEEEVETNVNGSKVMRKHRVPVMSDSTFCGSINLVLSYLKTNFPNQQIVIFTPIHRGFAQFGQYNVQPDESFANALGLYIDDYVAALRQAGEVWSMPVIDFYAVSGLYPNEASQDGYIANVHTDRLHPNDAGHYRLARTAQYQLQALPANFK